MELFKRGERMKKLRFSYSILLLLCCFVFSGVSVMADDTMDQNALAGLYGQSEAETESEAVYVDGKLTQSEVDQYVQSYAGMISSLYSFSEEEVQVVQKTSENQSGFEGVFETYEELQKMDLGTFQSYENTEVVENSAKDVHLLFDMVFQKKTVTLDVNIAIYDNLGVNYKNLSIANRDDIMKKTGDKTEETLGGKLQQALANTLMGMGTVFIVLIFISLIISLFRYIPAITQKVNQRKAKQAKQLLPVVPQSKDAGLKGADAAEDSPEDHQELIAVIAAAIAASEQVSTDSFVVRSIRRR